MPTRDSMIQRRIVAMERIKASLPDVQFKQVSHLAGPEFQYVVDLEAVADALDPETAETPDTKGK